MPQRTRKDPLAEYNRKRDFGKTSEPSGVVRKRDGTARLEFVLQRHAATSLHFDLRLELDGVMKSWAVPRGPSFDPADKRLAMEVEDHPMEYNFFEGTIPSGEYGGGTVMVWDRGTYFPDEADPRMDPQEALRKEHAKGKISITFLGERIHGSYALVRTDSGAKPKWLMIKHRDQFVQRGVDPVKLYPGSLVTGRTLDEIAEEDATDGFQNAGIQAMLYRYATEVPTGRGWVYEPAIRGDRAHAYVTPDALQLITALPAAARKYKGLGSGLRKFAADAGISFVIDGEIRKDDGKPVFHVFDLILENDEILVDKPWTERRKRLEALLSKVNAPDVALVPVVKRGGATLADSARAGDWPGIVAKRSDSPYRPGERSGDWIRTLKRES